MADPDGLTKSQRALVNVAHEAILTAKSKGRPGPRSRNESRRDMPHRKASEALAAAAAAGVPVGVLQATVASAMLADPFET